jgi:hypothetical protein
MAEIFGYNVPDILIPMIIMLLLKPLLSHLTEKYLMPKKKERVKSTSTAEKVGTSAENDKKIK